jgi:hypothetical protein
MLAAVRIAVISAPLARNPFEMIASCSSSISPASSARQWVALGQKTKPTLATHGTHGGNFSVRRTTQLRLARELGARPRIARSWRQLHTEYGQIRTQLENAGHRGRMGVIG